MANTSLQLVGLDFDTIKSNLKTWFKTNTQFKDLDFEGSNINTLLELLAYNTYLNAYYTNMVGAEMFLDSAQLRDSIVSRAKELNYTPRSFTSAQAQLQLTITPTSTPATVVVAEGTTFTTRVGSNTFTFSTEDSSVITTANGVFVANVTVYEGAPISESFTMNYANTEQRFILSNPTIDTTTLDITVYEDSGATALTYRFADQLYGLDQTSQVYFVQAAENNQYEIIFGDNVFGRRPKDSATIVINYLASSGELPNGASLFTVDGPIDGWSNVSITTLASASGGAVAESIESIRFNAPRYYQTQGRAITESDYEILLKKQFPEIQAISVYGGDQHNPPVYGKVFISVDITNADGAPQTFKDTYQAFIKTLTPLTVTTEFIDPDFLYVEVVTEVKYNVNKTSKLSSDIAALTHAAISQYNTDNLNDFKSTLYGSQISHSINSTDSSIVSNSTQFRLIRKLTPTTGVTNNIVVDFEQALTTVKDFEATVDQKVYGSVFESTPFTTNGVRSILLDDSQGGIWICNFIGDQIQPIAQTGTIDYSTGAVNIANLLIDSYDISTFNLYARPASRDISSIRNTILEIEDADVNITVTGIKA